jgi:group I intron endonuclease
MPAVGKTKPVLLVDLFGDDESTFRAIVTPTDIGVYMIFNSTNGKVYIGSSSESIKGRWLDHVSDLVADRHNNDILKKAWRKYGKDSFQFLIVEICQSEDCIQREQYWMDYYKAYEREYGYNICRTAGSRLGTKHTDETKAKLSAANLARDPAIRERQAAAIRGRKHSEETKAKRAKSLRTAHAEGRMVIHHSKESKAKMAKASTGRKLSDKTKAKILAVRSIRGFAHTEETKRKMARRRNRLLYSKEGESS